MAGFLPSFSQKWQMIFPAVVFWIEFYDWKSKSADNQLFFCAVSAGFYLLNSIITVFKLYTEWPDLSLGSKCLLCYEFVAGALGALNKAISVVAIMCSHFHLKIFICHLETFKPVVTLLVRLAWSLVLLAFYKFENQANPSAAHSNSHNEDPPNPPDLDSPTRIDILSSSTSNNESEEENDGSEYFDFLDDYDSDFLDALDVFDEPPYEADPVLTRRAAFDAAMKFWNEIYFTQGLPGFNMASSSK